MSWDPDAIVLGAAAAHISFYERVKVRVIEFASRRNLRKAPAHYTVRRRFIDEDDVIERDGVRLTAPALTVTDLAAHDNGDAVDNLLRINRHSLAQDTLDRICSTFSRYQRRRGNRERRRVIKASRSNPWSQAERLLHLIMDQAGIKGWIANLKVATAHGYYFLDAGWKALKLAVEVDGQEVHLRSEAFESDRDRQNALVESGWTVLRFTWQMLQSPQRVISTIRSTIRLLERQRREMAYA